MVFLSDWWSLSLFWISCPFMSLQNIGAPNLLPYWMEQVLHVETCEKVWQWARRRDRVESNMAGLQFITII